MKWKINISEEKCTGCRLCQMICSWANDGGFSPARSHIQIDSGDSEAHFRIRFEKGCRKCGLCASYCSGRALHKVRGSVDVQAN